MRVGEEYIDEIRYPFSGNRNLSTDGKASTTQKNDLQPYNITLSKKIYILYSNLKNSWIRQSNPFQFGLSLKLICLPHMQISKLLNYLSSLAYLVWIIQIFFFFGLCTPKFTGTHPYKNIHINLCIHIERNARNEFLVPLINIRRTFALIVIIILFQCLGIFLLYRELYKLISRMEKINHTRYPFMQN